MKNNISCVYGDLMQEYFIVKEKHKKALDEKLQSKFGEYADVNVDTVPSEDGGHIALSFGMYNVREELVNFAKEVSNKINSEKSEDVPELTEVESKNTIQNLIDIYNLNLDIEWQEEPKSCGITIYYNDEDYKNMDVSNENNKWKFNIIDALYDSIKEFVDNMMKESIKCFDECWYYEYSSYIEK